MFKALLCLACSKAAVITSKCGPSYQIYGSLGWEKCHLSEINLLSLFFASFVTEPALTLHVLWISPQGFDVHVTRTVSAAEPTLRQTGQTWLSILHTHLGVCSSEAIWQEGQGTGRPGSDSKHLHVSQEEIKELVCCLCTSVCFERQSRRFPWSWCHHLTHMTRQGWKNWQDGFYYTDYSRLEWYNVR